jgi:hypothetical protein
VPKDLADDRGILDQRNEPQTATAPGTCQHIKPKRASHERSPAPPTPIGTTRGRTIGIRFPVAAADRLGTRSIAAATTDYLRPASGTGPEDPVIQNQIDARPRHQDRQAAQEIHRVEDEIGRAIPPRFSQRHAHSPVADQVQTIDGDRWA